MHRFYVILLMTLGGLTGFCGERSGASEDDTGTKRDTEIARDASAGTETVDAEVGDEDAPCLGAISGRVLKNGNDGIKALVVVCIGEAICHPPQETEADGTISWVYPDMEEGGRCVPHDFAGDEWLHVEIIAKERPEDYASYAFVTRPTTVEISDEGEDDVTLDIGDLALYELPAESVPYASSTGAVVDLAGLSFSLPKDGLVKQLFGGDTVPLEFEHDVRVFKAPLDEWDPPFMTDEPDVLYYISPRWSMVAEPGLVLSIEPPDGWADGDEGTVTLLGSWRTPYAVDEGLFRSDYIYRNDNGRCVNTENDDFERIPDGFPADCGNAEMVGGRIITAPIPRLTWVAISKQ